MDTQANRVDLTRYVSNLDRNVYAIYNLPEEVIAVIFAYVSRSPASFRDNLAKLLQDEELAVSATAGGMATVNSQKAARFHEKWVVGYGHSSVAEHAVAHLGVEQISRLASAELELANTFNSFTEYSQRYQRPQRGAVYIPASLPERERQEYLALQEAAFDTYEALLQGLIPHLSQTLSRQEGESDKRFQSRVEKIAFEDARYVLTLATYTSLGLTGNGRALRDTLVRLLSSPNLESRQLAQDLEREISQVIPTLLKHVKPSQYHLETRRELDQLPLNPPGSDLQGESFTGPRARFVDLIDYDQALTHVCIQLLISHKGMDRATVAETVQSWSRELKEDCVERALKHLRFFDNPRDEFRHLSYHMEMQLSEANWHQLLRHNRGTHFSFAEPTIRFGYTIPPHIREAGLTETYQQFIARAEDHYMRIKDEHPEAAPYCVTNAHHRQITATASLWEMYHLINLRTSPEAQWDIRETFAQLHHQLSKHHPALARYAQRRM
ncbi:FAD-dependent thymidylate synthase [Desmospora activa]|uniref:Flavin-dependent thymidylate synthase n=1 Tax=Desmospora activa DSM 45169 TaxID=1121389 RepID=A0A2T4Z706_9BACL|nr:FAD-dependent thymidylate synthase [Desmospora activa]PTM57656.1 flavin-dependent thymidylate synthase [Desmospora activa DSM 45169]